MTRQEALNYFIKKIKNGLSENEYKTYDWARRALMFDELSEKINKDNVVIFYFDWDLLHDLSYSDIGELFSLYCQAMPEYKAALLLPDKMSLEAVDKDALKEWIKKATEVYESI